MMFTLCSEIVAVASDRLLLHEEVIPSLITESLFTSHYIWVYQVKIKIFNSFF